MRRKTAPACVLFRIPPSSCGGQFRGRTSGVTFIRALRGQFTQEFPHLGPVDYVRRITGPKMKNESGDMGHRRGPDAGRSALGPFEEGPKAGEMALEATKGRSARARFSQGGREEGWTLAGKCLAGGGQCTSIGWTTVVQKPGKAPTLNRGTFGAKRRRGFGGLAPQCMKCHYRKTAAVTAAVL